MANLTNFIQNSDLAALAGKASGTVVSAIKQAAARTGANFAYLVQQANAESSFNPAAKAKTSSASGLYQFIESTWMNMVEKYGDKHGIDTSGKSRRDILALRNDPQTASIMAAEFAGENEKFLNAHWGGKVGSTELYFAHFMGASGASAFLKEHDANPQQQAALLFPAAAKANRNVFYEQSTGRVKTLDEVYAFFDKKFQIEDIQTPDIAIAEENISDVSHGSLYAQAPSVVRTKSYNPMPYYQMVSTPVEIMLLAQMDLPTVDRPGKIMGDKSSLFSKAYSYNQ